MDLAARIVLLVDDGYGGRVYASKRRFDANLSGGCNVPLAETPRAVDGAYGSRAQLCADALGARRIEAAGEDSDARGELALRVTGIQTSDAKLAVARSA